MAAAENARAWETLVTPRGDDGGSRKVGLQQRQRRRRQLPQNIEAQHRFSRAASQLKRLKTALRSQFGGSTIARIFIFYARKLLTDFLLSLFATLGCALSIVVLSPTRRPTAGGHILRLVRGCCCCRRRRRFLLLLPPTPAILLCWSLDQMMTTSDSACT